MSLQCCHMDPLEVVRPIAEADWGRESARGRCFHSLLLFSEGPCQSWKHTELQGLVSVISLSLYIINWCSWPWKMTQQKPKVRSTKDQNSKSDLCKDEHTAWRFVRMGACLARISCLVWAEAAFWASDAEGWLQGPLTVGSSGISEASGCPHTDHLLSHTHVGVWENGPSLPEGIQKILLAQCSGIQEDKHKRAGPRNSRTPWKIWLL